MPIGTSNTALQFNVAKLPVTRLSAEQKQQSIFWEIFTFIGIQLFALVLAPITAGFSEQLGISLGLSDFSISLLSGATGFATDFGINEIYDIATKTTSLNSTIINLMPALGFLGKISRGYRTSKIIKLANETKVINTLGVDNVKNLDELVKKLSGKQIVNDELKTIFDYRENITRENVLNNLGFISQRKYYSGFQKLEQNEINNYLEIRNNLQKINNSLVQKIKPYQEKQANILLAKVNSSLNEVSEMSFENWTKIVENLRQKNIGRNLILYLSDLRSKKIFNQKILNSLHTYSKKLTRLARRLNPNWYLKKILEKILEPAKEKFYEFKEKIQEKLAEEKEKLKSYLTKADEKAIIQEKLIPLKSNVFLGCKYHPIGISEDIALTIFYKPHEGKHRLFNYDPINVITTLPKVLEFLSAPEPMHYYLKQSGWALGWGLNKSKISKLISFAPPEFQMVVRDSFRTYRAINRLYRSYHKAKNIIHKWKEEPDSFKEKAIDYAVEGLFGRSLVQKGIKIFILSDKKSTRSTLKKVTNRFENRVKRRSRVKIFKEW